MNDPHISIQYHQSRNVMTLTTNSGHCAAANHTLLDLTASSPTYAREALTGCDRNQHSGHWQTHLRPHTHVYERRARYLGTANGSGEHW